MLRTILPSKTVYNRISALIVDDIAHNNLYTVLFQSYACALSTWLLVISILL